MKYLIGILLALTSAMGIIKIWMGSGPRAVPNFQGTYTYKLLMPTPAGFEVIDDSDGYVIYTRGKKYRQEISHGNADSYGVRIEVFDGKTLYSGENSSGEIVLQPPSPRNFVELQDIMFWAPAITHNLEETKQGESIAGRKTKFYELDFTRQNAPSMIRSRANQSSGQLRVWTDFETGLVLKREIEWKETKTIEVFECQQVKFGPQLETFFKPLVEADLKRDPPKAFTERIKREVAREKLGGAEKKRKFKLIK